MKISTRNTIILILILFYSCKKDISKNDTVTGGPDLTTKVISSVSGFITEANDLPVSNATVVVGNKITFTNHQGFFEVADAMVVKIAATVTVTKSGFFTGIETFTAQSNQSYTVRLKLIPKVLSGNFAATSGGVITLNNGLSISFPSNAIVNPGGAVYTGTTNVAAYWINPLSPDLQNIMPGDLRGINTGGAITNLITYGMCAVELTGSTGELLQMALGKKAVLTMPLPSSMIATAPAIIPLWHFDEIKGLWIEEGSAIKTGNKYVGEVSHFSFWNCDLPSDFIQFNATVTDVSGIPASGEKIVKVSKYSDTTSSIIMYTNNYGQVSGLIPKNQQLLLEVFLNYECPLPAYSQVFNTTAVNVSINISIPHLARLTGNVRNCNGNPVTSGFINVKIPNGIFRFPLNANGAYDFYLPVTTCGINNNAELVADDITAIKQSAPYYHTIINGANAITSLTACSPPQEYMSMTINGVTSNYIDPSSDFYTTMLPFDQPLYLDYSYGRLLINSTGIGVNSSQQLLDIKSVLLPDSTNSTTPVMVHITEYGSTGGYISGNFSGILVNPFAPGTLYNISATFRAKRHY